MTKADLGADFPPKAATFLRDEEIEAVAAYVIGHLQGKGEPDREDCVAFWGEASRECARDALKSKSGRAAIDRPASPRCDRRALPAQSAKT